MEFLQELILTVFVAAVFWLAVAKLGLCSACNSSDYDKASAFALDKGPVVEEVKSVKELSRKGKKRVKFVDDFLVKQADEQEGEMESCENLGLLKVESVGGVIVEEKCEDESFVKRVEEFKAKESDENSDREMHDVDFEEEGSQSIGMLIEEKAKVQVKDVVCGEKKDSSTPSEMEGVFVEEKKDEVDLDSDHVAVGQKEGSGIDQALNEAHLEEKVNGGIGNYEDDDWEGIERSELEKVFAEAVNYVEYGGKGRESDADQLGKLGSDVQMQLYGLHKLAVEGPCHEPQPMALKVSARARWNAWQRLGSMSPEVAMEQYVRTLSDGIPGWNKEHFSDDFELGTSSGSSGPGLSSSPEDERKFELNITTSTDDSNRGIKSVEKEE